MGCLASVYSTSWGIRFHIQELVGLSTVECNCKVTLTTELLSSVLLCGNLLFLSALDSARLCIGNSEQSFIEIVKH